MLYNSIDEMPIGNFQAMQRYLLIDAGVGGDIEGISVKITQILAFNSKGDRASVDRGLRNIAEGLAMIVRDINPKFMAFCCIIHSINGKEVTDLSIEGITRISERLSKVRTPMGLIWDSLDTAKKKWTRRSRRTSRRDRIRSN